MVFQALALTARDATSHLPPGEELALRTPISFCVLTAEVEANIHPKPAAVDSFEAVVHTLCPTLGDSPVTYLKRLVWSDEGQDIAEYAVMLAVILVLVVGTIRLVGSNANNAFSQVGSALNQ